MLLISFGTQSEYLKIRPLLPLLEGKDIPFKLLHILENDVEVKESHDILDIYDISSDPIANIQLNVIDQAENWLKDTKAVLVVGDSTSAFGMALAAFTRGIKIIHMEAGLRTYNVQNPYPEEFNRRAISLMTNANICITERNAKELSQEGIRSAKYITGSTLLDGVDTTPLETNNTVLVSFKDEPSFKLWLPEIVKLSKSTPSLTYLYYEMGDLIKNIKQAKIIISNNFDIQMLACYLNKKIIICSKATELTESIWLNATICKNPDYLSTAFWKILPKQLTSTSYVCPFGSGQSSEKVVEILAKELA